LLAISPVNPSLGVLFPVSLSDFGVSNRPNPQEPFLSYDNLFYPSEKSPLDCPQYPFAGGYLDIYGIMFKLANGDSVDVWSNGVQPGISLNDGATVVDGSTAIIDSQSGGLAGSVPEPGSCLLLAAGLVGSLVVRKRFAD